MTDKQVQFAGLKHILQMSDKSVRGILLLTFLNLKGNRQTTTFSFQEFKKVEKKNVTVHKFNLFPTCPQG